MVCYQSIHNNFIVKHTLEMNTTAKVFTITDFPLSETSSSNISSREPVINLRGLKGSQSLPNISWNGVKNMGLLNCVLAANKAG